MRLLMIFLIFLIFILTPLVTVGLCQTKQHPKVVILTKEDFIEKQRTKEEVYNILNVTNIIDTKYVSLREVTIFDEKNNEWLTLRSFQESIHGVIVVIKDEKDKIIAMLVTINTQKLYSGIFLSWDTSKSECESECEDEAAIVFKKNIETFLQILEKKLEILKETNAAVDSFITKENDFFSKMKCQKSQ